MDNPIVTIRERRLGYRFMAAEAAWILSGDNKVSTISPFSKAISDFSDDGYQFFGAYGPKVLMQLPYIVQSLLKDEYSRQSVLTVWRESPMPSRDVPCTVAMQWMIRDGFLHCFVNMRSSDAWLGVPYDWFNFSMISAYLLLILRRAKPAFENIALGDLHFYAASQHLYETEWQAATNLLDGITSTIKVKDFNPREFESPEHLVDHLWVAAERKVPFEGWLEETQQ
jgi:thymidylate synthase